MKRVLFAVVMVALVAGCSSAPKQVSPPQEQRPREQEVAPPVPAPAINELPPVGAVVDWSALPAWLQDPAYLTPVSPDGQWAARTASSDQDRDGLFILSLARDKAWYVDDGLKKAPGARPLFWTPRNTLVYHHDYGGDVRDTWYEADPATGKRTEFAPEALTGRSVKTLRFSPDGRRFLADAGGCDGCNKPSENAITTYMVDLTTEAVQEIGVDVQAEWDGDQVKAVAMAPHGGYSGPAFWDTLQQGGLPRPLTDSIQVGATDYVEFRAYRRDASPGEPPLAVIPAYDTVDTYNTWGLWWPDPPAEPFRLEAWAEVRATVPEVPPRDPLGNPVAEIRQEGGKRWAVVFSREITLLPDPPKQTVLLTSVQMWDVQNGWATGSGGRILRTADGGATWRDVTPAGFARCAGRYRPRQTESFADQTAVVAIACDRTGPDGKWTRESGRVSLFRSTDGGATWQTADIDTDYRFASATRVEFLSALDGYIVVQPLAERFVRPEPGAIYRTSDGGRTWKKITDTATGFPSAREVMLLDVYRGWAVGTLGASLWSTADGGATWQPVIQNAPVGAVSAPAFITGAEGYYVNGRQLFWTTDGGLTWSKRSDLPKGWGRPAFLTPTVGYLWEYESRTVYWTRDGGRTWAPIPWDINPTGINQVQFLDEQHGFAVQGALWKTVDGARSWTETYPQMSP